jgi:hypothetical protein
VHKRSHECIWSRKGTKALEGQRKRALKRSGRALEASGKANRELTRNVSRMIVSPGAYARTNVCSWKHALCLL